MISSKLLEVVDCVTGDGEGHRQGSVPFQLFIWINYHGCIEVTMGKGEAMSREKPTRLWTSAEGRRSWLLTNPIFQANLMNHTVANKSLGKEPSQSSNSSALLEAPMNNIYNHVLLTFRHLIIRR